MVIGLVFLFNPRFISAGEINFAGSNEIFINPERGFSSQVVNAISMSLINSLKNQQVSVIQRIYTIPQFINTSLSEAFLLSVEADFNTARAGGMKLVLRFSYTNDQNGADAPLDVILTHISQLKPLFEKHVDVIAYVEAGFIGAWGEWYYSSNDLNNTESRRSVLYALLEALPAERCVVVRTPDYKRKIFSDNNPLTPEEAFNASNKARTGAHNDCFLASADDYGTYINIEADKNFLNLDNRYVPQGGETCNPSAYSDCAHALADLPRMRWSLLNKDYNTTVLNSWKTAGCMDEIKQRLGYRLRLLNGNVADSLKPGGEFLLQLNLVNDGFASPYNPRNFEIILRHEQTKAKYRLLSAEDPRRWLPDDTVRIQISAGIPADLPQGAYQLMVHLSDPLPALHDNPDYSIRLANENVWEDSTGYNSLQHIININPDAAGEFYAGEDFFEPLKTTPPRVAPIELDGLFDDWETVPQLDLYPDQEDSADALNNAVDLIDVWAAEDEYSLYLNYRLAGAMASGYFYHVFIDGDHDTTTGFHSHGSYAGIDFMIENESLWQYSGMNGAWGWTYRGPIGLKKGVAEAQRIELALDRAVLGTSAEIGLVFNINDNNDAVEDDYAPNAYQQRSYHYTFATTDIAAGPPPKIPQTLFLKIFPNPFNSSVTFQYHSQQAVAIEIYDVRGRLVRRFPGTEAGGGKLVWDGKSCLGQPAGSGMYLIRLISGAEQVASKLIMLK
jgi:hypothetical protein